MSDAVPTNLPLIPSESTEITSLNAREHSLLSLVNVAEPGEKSFLAPFVNKLALEPVNTAVNCFNAASDTGTWVLDRVSGNDYKPLQLGKLDEMKVASAAPGSTASYGQEILEAAGAVIVFAAASKLTGKGMRLAGELVPAEVELGSMEVGKVARTIAQNSHVATVVGATAYEGLRDTKSGESHTSNALSTLVGFSLFEAANSKFITDYSSLPMKLGQRFVVGTVGGAAQTNVASLIQNHEFAEADAVSSSAFYGGMINAFMPAGRRVVERAVENPMVGRQPYVSEMADRLHVDALRSLPTGEVVDAATWADPAFVKTVNEAARFDLNTRLVVDGSETTRITHGDNLIHLNEGGAPLEVLQELAHRRIIKDAEPSFQKLAKKIVSADPSDPANDTVKQDYVEMRLQHEIDARTMQNEAAVKLGSNLRAAVEPGVLRGTGSYVENFEHEADKFIASNGTSRPDVDHAGPFNHESQFVGTNVEHSFKNERIAGRTENCFRQVDDAKVYFGYSNAGQINIGFPTSEGFQFKINHSIRDVRVVSRMSGVHDYYLNGSKEPVLTVDKRTHKVQVSWTSGDKLVSTDVAESGWYRTDPDGATYEVSKSGFLRIKLDGILQKSDSLGAKADKVMLIEQADGSRSLQVVDATRKLHKEIRINVQSLEQHAVKNVGPLRPAHDLPPVPTAQSLRQPPMQMPDRPLIQPEQKDGSAKPPQGRPFGSSYGRF